MSKYRLIKEYPNSPELGFITDETMYFPSSYPEFWEKIIEKEQFEVLSTTGIDVALKVPYEFKLETKYVHQITSIKRLTNNTIFSIGDKIKMIGHANDKAPESITKIVFNKEGIPCLFTNTFHNNGINIMRAIKCEKLFTTEDGTNIFENDIVHWVKLYGEFKYLYPLRFIKEHLMMDFISGYRVFSTEKAAKDWIYLNSPKYSLQDIFNAKSDESKFPDHFGINFDKLIKK